MFCTKVMMMDRGTDTTTTTTTTINMKSMITWTFYTRIPLSIFITTMMSKGTDTTTAIIIITSKNNIIT